VKGAVTTEDMRILERNCEALGIPTLLLMESAGKAVSEEIAKRVKINEFEVHSFIGSGGKGGDGLSASRHLASMGARVVLHIIGEIKHRDSLIQLKAIESLDLSIELTREIYSVERAIIVDALLGTGVRGKVVEPYLSAIEKMNESKGFKVSIDIPSGINPDTGEVLGKAFRADLTVSLHALKRGLVNNPYAGEIVVADIGIPPEAFLYVGPGDVEVRLPKKKMLAKKGDNGRVLVIAGGGDYTGAPAYVSMASYLSGVDLVYLVSPLKITNRIVSKYPEIIPVSLKEEYLTLNSLKVIEGIIDKVDVVIAGPGLTTEKEVGEAINEVIEMVLNKRKKCVLDADALKLSRRKELNEQFVITPHAGEFKAFFGIEVGMDFKERIKAVKKVSGTFKGVILLKGYVDIISQSENIRLNKSGNPAMTVGGTGDVLAGLIGGLMARGLKPFDAACVGAYLNGISGSMAYKEKGDSLLPTDLLNYLPKAISNPMEASSFRVYTRPLNGVRIDEINS
jgi:NAD(P)H-hydrate epimerase